MLEGQMRSARRISLGCAVVAVAVAVAFIEREWSGPTQADPAADVIEEKPSR
jgi:hypothetical protein